MSKLPQLPRSGKLARRSRNSSPWADLIAFLGILTLGTILIVLRHATGGSLGTIYAALGGLYGVYKRLRLPAGPGNAEEPDSKSDDDSH